VKVIYCRGKKNPWYTQDANHQTVTVIECISADGGVIQPKYIYKEGKHLLGRHGGVQDKAQATLAWSTKDGTDNELELKQVEQNFEKYTIKMFVPFD